MFWLFFVDMFEDLDFNTINIETYELIQDIPIKWYDLLNEQIIDPLNNL